MASPAWDAVNLNLLRGVLRYLGVDLNEYRVRLRVRESALGELRGELAGHGTGANLELGYHSEFLENCEHTLASGTPAQTSGALQIPVEGQ